MESHPKADTSAADTSAADPSNRDQLDAHAARLHRLTTWLMVLAVSMVLPLCLCGALVMLVLLGIIAEPETVIEQIIRFLMGG